MTVAQKVVKGDRSDTEIKSITIVMEAPYPDAADQWMAEKAVGDGSCLHALLCMASWGTWLVHCVKYTARLQGRLI